MSTFSRRHVIRNLGALLSLPLLTRAGLGADLAEIQHASPEDAARDEDFWRQVRLAFPVSATLVNLNNGGVSPHPQVVADAWHRYQVLSNEAPTYYMWRILDQGREPLRAQLATFAGVSPEEIALQRNATEALETVIMGLSLRTGDEVVHTRYDYPNMCHAWRQRAMREGIVLRELSFELPAEDTDLIVKTFTDAFTDRTRVVHITQVINWTGQILPVAEIARAARARGIQVLVDGAHAFAHLDFKIPELDCDYFGTSLHKWLCAPIGTGMLYVRRERIADLYPLLAAAAPHSADIRKFEVLGTRSFAAEQAIGQALQFHQMIGTARMEARLRYLKDYWMAQVQDIPRIRLYTSRLPHAACGLGTFGIEGKTPQEIESFLLSTYKVHTSPVTWEDLRGVRVSPHVYTLLPELDQLVAGIRACAAT
ncbi:MAG: aminotransferase class V-fold PLP-dependent enzyme [Bacteroidia bacterium]|nr:aminotransferase class V-fold PLP-dependent enzyme [Bacteroidia bacterium]